MASLNKVILLGNLGNDPEVKEVNGQKVANFSMATTESYTDKTTNEKKEITEWSRIVIWGNLAKVVENYCKKGSQVLVEGKLRTRSYDDKDGVKRYLTEILANSLVLLGKPPVGSSEPAAQNEPAPQNASEVLNEPADDSELPF